MNTLAWLLTYFLPLAMIAFGTLTQGDDSAWSFSLFVYAPIAAIGASILILRYKRIHDCCGMGLFHILTVVLAVMILPGYWSRVTIQRDHIGAGFDASYVGSFEAERWHFWWAPVMTGLTAVIVFLVIYAFRKAKTQITPSVSSQI
jgi:glucan phosphoethanolaminetransferase (alkaline phosphatase superfamily)